MKTTFLKSLTGVTATMLLAGYAGAQNTPEVEPNNVKSNATPVTFTAGGETLSGLTTGTTTTGAGTANTDFFRVKTAPAALGIYRHRIALTTTGTAGHSAAIMGLPAAGTATDTQTVQTSATSTTPARMAQWYGFGKEEELYFRVTGGTGTTADYTGTYSMSAVTPVSAPAIAAGSVTISTYGQGHSSDTELFLFDSNMNLLRLNDDGPSPLTGFMSQLTANLTDGVYYIAVSNYNTAMNVAQETSPLDRSTAGPRMDFPNVMANSNTTTAVNCGLTINDGNGAHPIALTKTAAYDVMWLTFTVATVSTNPQGTFGAAPSSVDAGNTTLLTVTVAPGTNPASTGITVSADLTNLGGSAGTTLFDNGTNGDVTAGDNIFSLSYTVPGATTGGAKSVPFTVADAQSRSSSGTGSVTVVAPPANTDLGTLTNGTTTAPTLPVATAQQQWYKFTLATPVSAAGGSWLDIVSNGALSGGTFTNDTHMALYRSNGTVVSSDDDDGPGAFSALTYGLASPTRANGDGPAHNGRDGAETLTAGTYYLVVGGYQGTFNANFGATSASNSSGSVGATLNLGPVATNPTVAGQPAAGTSGGSVLVRGSVTAGGFPASTGLAVTADLSAIGGSATQTLFDDGTNGDVTGGDNMFSYAYTLPALAENSYLIPLTVTDAQSRSGSGNAVINVDGHGQLPATATNLDGVGPITSVSGVLGAGDVDMFRIHLCDPAAFSASTVGGSTLDTQLFLFRADGTGVVMSDDEPSNTGGAQSTITNQLVSAEPAGDYYVAVSVYNIDAKDAGNAYIFPNSDGTGCFGSGFRCQLPPTSPTAVVASWDVGTAGNGSYTIAFTGVSGEACAPACPGNECGPQDYNGDGDSGTDADIEAFFACLGGNCCATCFCQGSDFNGDGDFGTDADIEAFFRVLGGNPC